MYSNSLDFHTRMMCLRYALFALLMTAMLILPNFWG